MAKHTSLCRPGAGGCPEGSVQMFEESHVFPRMGPKEFRNGYGDGHRANASGVKHDTGQAWALDPAAWGSVRALQFTSSETSGKLLHFWASVSPSGKWHLIRSLRGLNVFVHVKERAWHGAHRKEAFNILMYSNEPACVTKVEFTHALSVGETITQPLKGAVLQSTIHESFSEVFYLKGGCEIIQVP